jgi:hypothetical protein
VARGWESKAIESQLEDKARAGGRGGTEPLSAGERAARERRQGLELTRSRILAELRVSRVPAHRAMLDQALRAVDEQLRRSDEPRAMSNE